MDNNKKEKKKAENEANKPEKPTKISVVGYGRWDSTFSVAEDNNKNAQSWKYIHFTILDSSISKETTRK